MFAYAELDAWLFVGGTLGVGYGGRSGWQPVLGIWEALPLPLEDGRCEDLPTVVVSAGYRWTGMHELYVAAKGGRADRFCQGG